jgi:hypothetical protein
LIKPCTNGGGGCGPHPMPPHVVPNNHPHPVVPHNPISPPHVTPVPKANSLASYFFF